ncbi:hypothetical protein GGX14DRAFT_611634 [Mycena pura]|uniref:Uncharacterized protein n=1 Tax=Mycena pura TaxID=153505 RepID=A0AAD7E4W8_9AGAR|nr:hypothetical protein GGX14DRAFT_611634 [Mycena pura]
MMNKAAEPSADSAESTEPQVEPSHAPSPPPPYVSRSTTGTAGQPNPELPSVFRPPSPSSFPHPHPHTGPAFSAGPTPISLPTATPADVYYAYYDPRSAYSLALADRRALVRFWSAFLGAMCILAFLWFIGPIQLETRR